MELNADELLTLAKNISLDEIDVFQNETISETMGEAHQKPF